MSYSDRVKLSAEQLDLAALLVATVATVYGLARADMFARSRSGQVAEARQVAMFALRDQMRLTHQQVGLFFGKHHATVIHACRKVGEFLSVDVDFKRRWPLVASAVLSARHGYEQRVIGGEA